MKKFLLLTAAGVFINMIAVAQDEQRATDSSKQTIYVPIRVGIVPFLSTQGISDARTHSHFSLNLFGGVTGSVDGVECSSLFNIETGNVQWVQAAGLFNAVKGNARGVQAAGLFNAAKGYANGLQAGGISNFAGKEVTGLQAAGVYNHAGSKLVGMQAAGVANYAGQSKNGIQVAGVANVARTGTANVQVSGVINYSHRIKGVQIGLINIADTLDGLAIGLINISKNGFYRVALYTDEVLNSNIAFRSGNRKLYSILFAGVNAGKDDKVFSYGAGIGHEIKITKHLSLNPEATSQYVYLGNWDYTNLLNKAHLQLQVRLGKSVALFGGASFAFYYSNQHQEVHGYKFPIPTGNYHTYDLWNDDWTGWIGWSAGISFF